MKWPDAAAKTRMSMVDALATAAVNFVRDTAGKPADVDLRRMLVSHLLPPTTRHGEISAEDQEIVAWLREQSRPLYDLTEAAATRSLLDALATKMDGKSTAATVYRRKRAVLFNLLSYAVEEELLPDNPLLKIKKKAPKVDTELDPGVVANATQVHELLTAVTYVGRRNADRAHTCSPSSLPATTLPLARQRAWPCEKPTASCPRRDGANWLSASRGLRPVSGGQTPVRSMIDVV